MIMGKTMNGFVAGVVVAVMGVMMGVGGVVGPAMGQTYQFGRDQPTDAGMKQLAQLAQAEAESESARAWDASIRTYVFYDSNVQQVPDATVFFTGDKNSWGLGLQFDGEFRVVQNEQWTIGAGLVFDEVIHFDDNPTGMFAGKDPNDYNLTTFEPRGFAEYAFDLNGKQAVAGFEYVFRRDWLEDGKPEVSSHTVIGSLLVELNEQWTGELFYAWVADENFKVPVATPGISSRDGQRHTLGLRGTYTFENQTSHLNVGYLFVRNDTDGSNYNSHAHVFELGYDTWIGGPFWLLLESAIAIEDYDGFISSFNPAPGREEQYVYDLRGSLLYVVDEHLSFDVTMGYAIWDANDPLWDADGFYTEFGVTWRF